MKLREIYNLAVKQGIGADPRGKSGVGKLLARRKQEYEDLSKSKQQEFDLEDLVNPYSDSRLLWGDDNLEVDKIMAGIDITAAEVLLADRLNQKNPQSSIDLLIAHHPSGGPLAALHEVMEVQADLMAKHGVPINVAEGLMEEKIAEVKRRFMPRNHNEAVDAAKLLGLALLCTHTITDNLVYEFLEKLIKTKHPETVGDVLKMLKSVPEYQEAMKGKAGPMIFSGKEKNRAGLVTALDITGGTEPSEKAYEKLAIAGVGTIIAMHAGEEHRKECLKYHINLVVAGHISSDSLGMNLFLDELEKRNVEIIASSGLIRVSRNR